MSYSFDEFFDSLATLAISEGSSELEPLNPKYEATIHQLATALYAASIPYTYYRIFDGAQLRFPWCEGDVVCHSGSYGSHDGKVESYCFPWDEGDVTKLSVEDAYLKISAYYTLIQLEKTRERKP